MPSFRTALLLASAAALLAACGQKEATDQAQEPSAPAAAEPSAPAGAEPAHPAETATPAAPGAATPAATTPAATPAAATPAAPAGASSAVASLPAPYNTGDIENGKNVFNRCKSCHTITQGGAHLIGPNLYGVFGRKIGSASGYTYSEAVKNSSIVLDASHLDDWIANPREYLPGTKMTFAGISNPKDRLDLIAYLKTETGYKR